MPEGTPTEIFHQEIAALEARLAAKKQELLHSGAEKHEKTLLKEAIAEHVTPSAPTVVSPISTATTQATPTRTATAAEIAQVNLLIAHAFTNGIASAVDEAKKSGDAFLIDLLHDRLTDEYYQKLLAARKVNPN